MAIGIPVFAVLLWAFPTAGLSAGPSLLLSTLLAFIVVETMERFVLTTRKRQRTVTMFFIGILAFILFLLPIYLALWDSR